MVFKMLKNIILNILSSLTVLSCTLQEGCHSQRTHDPCERSQPRCKEQGNSVWLLNSLSRCSAWGIHHEGNWQHNSRQERPRWHDNLRVQEIPNRWFYRCSYTVASDGQKILACMTPHRFFKLLFPLSVFITLSQCNQLVYSYSGGEW